MGKKLQEIAPLLEFLVGTGLGGFFHWILHDPQAAYVIFGVGVLVSLTTYLLKDELARLGERLSGQYEGAHELTFALARIADPECLTKAHGLLAAAKKELSLLQLGYIPLDETEFYLSAAKAVDQASHWVKAVDPLNSGWDTRGALVNFYQSNLRALERKVRITRIFVLQRDQLHEPEAQKVLLAQVRDGIDVRIAHREELPSPTDAASWASDCSFDFAVYDGRTATEVYRAPGSYYGQKTSQSAEVARYQRLCDLIEHNAHAVTVEAGRIVLAVAATATPGDPGAPATDEKLPLAA
jgi:hypothetical protein